LLITHNAIIDFDEEGRRKQFGRDEEFYSIHLVTISHITSLFVTCGVD
jgi:hypothetical protein